MAMDPNQVKRIANDVIGGDRESDREDPLEEQGEAALHSAIPVPKDHCIDCMEFQKADNGGVIAKTRFKRHPNAPKPKEGEGSSMPWDHSHTAVLPDHHAAAQHLKHLFKKY